MKKVFIFILGATALVGFYTACSAKDEVKDANTNAPAQASAPAAATQDQETQQLIKSFQTLQNQEVRAIVLQELLNREVSELRQMQAVFCDQYKLDADKWRQGLYRYDDKQKKFVEVPPQKTA